MSGKTLKKFCRVLIVLRKNLEIFSRPVYDVPCKRNRRLLLFAHGSGAGGICRALEERRQKIETGRAKGPPAGGEMPAENGQTACFVQATALIREVEIRNEQISQALGTGRGGTA